MKKKRLAFTTQTIRVLGQIELAHVAGAGTTLLTCNIGGTMNCGGITEPTSKLCLPPTYRC